MDDDTDMHTTPLGEPGVGQSSLKMAIAPEPIRESEEEQRLALEKMKSTLAAPGVGPQRRGTVARCVDPPRCLPGAPRTNLA
jgi:hypothetical protein